MLHRTRFAGPYLIAKSLKTHPKRTKPADARRALPVVLDFE
jgi:hypothetical protein